MNKMLKVLVLLVFVLYLTGCWDKVEIDDRAYINVIGYDIFNEEAYEEALNKDIGRVGTPKPGKDNRFVITFGFPNLNAIGKNATSEKSRYVVSTVASSPYQATTYLATRLNKTIFFKHTKALIIGEEFARNADYIKEVIDNAERHYQLSRKVLMFITEGTAKEVIEVENIFEPKTGVFLEEIVAKGQRSSRHYSQTFQDALNDLKSSGNTLLPRIVPGKEEIQSSGSAIIKDYKLIGWLGELETRAVSFLKNHINQEVIDVDMDVDGVTPVPFVIAHSSTEKSAKIVDEKITIDMNIQIEGYLEQFKVVAGEELFDNKTLEIIEKKAEEKLKEQIDGTIEKLQKEFKVDVIGIGDYLSKFEPDTWENIKDDWDNNFSDVQINASIDAKLRRIGMTK